MNYTLAKDLCVFYDPLYKILNNSPWWSKIYAGNGFGYYFFDDCFKNFSPTYTPKTFIYESFSEFTKQMN